jgi:hypothetical protein
MQRSGVALKNSLGIAVLTLVFAAPAASQTVYKSIMPDGKIVYGEKPASGAKKVDKIDPPPAQTGMTTITPQEKARADQLANPKFGAPANAGGGRDADRKALQDAEAAREAGKEPLPGERQGLKGGGSRLTDEYHARQKSLDEAVESARRRAGDSK